MFRQRLNKCGAVAIEYLPKPRDLLDEISFLHEGAGPKRGDHLFFRDRPSVIFQEQQEGLEFLSPKVNRMIASEQKALPGIENELPELVNYLAVLYGFH